MKKSLIVMAAAVALATSSCGSLAGSSTGSGTSTSTGSSVLGGILGSIANKNTAGELLNMVIGGVKVEKSQLVGTWQYSAPGCAFTSEKLLAKAGGAVAAAKVKEQLETYYNRAGISSSNTYFTFTDDNKFSAKINNIPLSGTYTYDASTCEIKLKTLLLSTTGHVTRTTSGIGLMFESKKLLSLLQAATKLSANSKIEAVGDIASNYDGIRLGIEMKKQ